MNTVKHYLVCYDIRDDKRRYKLDRVLGGFGERVQLSIYECRLTIGELHELVQLMKAQIANEDSVFECEIDDTKLKKLQREMIKIIDGQDKVIYFRLCNKDRRQMIALGSAKISQPADYYYV